MADAWRPRALSYSAVQLYLECPAAYHRRYVARISDPAPARMVFGRVMAAALEALHRGQDGEVIWLREYERQIYQAGITDAPPTSIGLTLLAQYRAYGVAQGEPERRFRIWLPNRDAVPVPISGVMDLAAAEGVWEFKCARTKWDQARVDASGQAALYRYAYWQVFQRKPQWVRFIVLNPQTATLTELVTYPAGPELYAFELEAAATWQGIRRREYPPRCGDCPACLAAGFVKPQTNGAVRAPNLELGVSW